MFFCVHLATSQMAALNRGLFLKHKRIVLLFCHMVKQMDFAVVEYDKVKNVLNIFHKKFHFALLSYIFTENMILDVVADFSKRLVHNEKIQRLFFEVALSPCSAHRQKVTDFSLLVEQKCKVTCHIIES